MDILEEFRCYRLENNPSLRFHIDRTEKKNSRIKKALLETSIKKCSKSVYGGCIRKDIEKIYKCVTQQWMKNEYHD